MLETACKRFPLFGLSQRSPEKSHALDKKGTVIFGTPKMPTVPVLFPTLSTLPTNRPDM
jgi:hypothetical protein